MPSKLRRARTALRSPRGQAMVEYSSIVFFMMLGLVVGMSVPMFPGRKNLLEIFMMAYQVYYDSFYFMLNLPFP